VGLCFGVVPSLELLQLFVCICGRRTHKTFVLDDTTQNNQPTTESVEHAIFTITTTIRYSFEILVGFIHIEKYTTTIKF
jgi:hypothetical protein